MKRLIANILLTVLVMCLAASCDNSLKVQAKKFREQEILIPQDLKCIRNGDVFPARLTMRDNLLIIYYAPKECTSCAISHLLGYEPLFSQKDRLGYEIAIILSKSEDKSVDIPELMEESCFLHPVYYDENCSFARLNPHIPEDSRFHAFLLDESGRPKFIGNPLKSNRLWEIFVEVLGT